MLISSAWANWLTVDIILIEFWRLFETTRDTDVYYTYYRWNIKYKHVPLSKNSRAS